MAILSGSVCYDPPVPQHGVLVFSRNTSGAILAGVVAEYQCKDGYRLVGPHWKVCKEDGEWDPKEIIICQQKN